MHIRMKHLLNMPPVSPDQQCYQQSRVLSVALFFDRNPRQQWVAALAGLCLLND